MLPIFLKKILALFDLSIWGSYGKMLSMSPSQNLILFDLYFRGLRYWKMLPIFLKKVWLYSIYQFWQNAVHFSLNIFDLTRLVLSGIKEGENAANVSQENFGSIRFINFGFTMLSILPTNFYSCSTCTLGE